MSSSRSCAVVGGTVPAALVGVGIVLALLCECRDEANDEFMGGEEAVLLYDCDLSLIEDDFVVAWSRDM